MSERRVPPKYIQHVAHKRACPDEVGYKAAERALGTARLTALHSPTAVLKIGLSWPSLSKALGRPVADPSRWAVLYLGSAVVADLGTDRDIVAINRKGEIEDNQRAILKDIEGIVADLRKGSHPDDLLCPRNIVRLYGAPCAPYSQRRIA
jgi:hypothetical protein